MPKTTPKTKVKKAPRSKAGKASAKSVKVDSISSSERLARMLDETEQELQKLQPKIEKLEREVEKLKGLKLTKQKLITLKLSLKSILSNFQNTGNFSSVTEVAEGVSTVNSSEVLKRSGLNTSQASYETSKSFFPDQAFEQVNQVLKKNSSLNYELFRAIVFNGGRASTEQLRQYMVENGITQPGSGKGFEDMPLTDISSRVNYLIRKGVVRSDGRGMFVSLLGWDEETETT